MKTGLWLTTAAIVSLLSGLRSTQAAPADTPSKIDQAVVAELSSLYGTESHIIAHVDLTKPFATNAEWTLVVGKVPDKPAPDDYSLDEPGPVSVCFVKGDVPNCSEKTVLEEYRRLGIRGREGARPFYALLANAVVHAGPQNTLPLLMLKTCTESGGNGNCSVSTFLFDYDRSADRFRLVFVDMTGRNQNEETRFLDSGPLLGDVITVYPTSDAPFGYHLVMYKRHAAGRYEQALRYRSRTRYDDGNRLAVIDSEMPEILKRLGLWKPGDPLPTPARRPAGCTQLVLRKGVEWCE